MIFTLSPSGQVIAELRSLDDVSRAGTLTVLKTVPSTSVITICPSGVKPFPTLLTVYDRVTSEPAAGTLGLVLGLIVT